MRGLAEELWHGERPVGYVSFLSALIHHGVIVDAQATIQVASLDRAGPWEVREGPLEYYLLPRDLWLGFGSASFEGAAVPLATPEKALLDWCWLAEELGLDRRLDEIEWSLLDLPRLDRLADDTGIRYRDLLPAAAAGTSRHDQQRLRDEALARLR